MPHKTCPECNQKVGVRTKICKCGHNFYSVSDELKHAVFGTWMYDRPKGLPKVEMPTKVPEGQLSLQEIREWVTYEGIGECVIGYFRASQIADKKLAQLWKDARKSMQAVIRYLYSR